MLRLGPSGPVWGADLNLANFLSADEIDRALENRLGRVHARPADRLAHHLRGQITGRDGGEAHSPSIGIRCVGSSSIASAAAGFRRRRVPHLCGPERAAGLGCGRVTGTKPLL